MSNIDTPSQRPSPPPPKTPARRRWLRRAAEVALVLAVILGVRAYQQRDIVTGPAPALVGVLLDGKVFTLAPIAGQPQLVHFWASWCPICRAEQSSIAALARDYPTVTVAMQSGSDDEVVEYMQKQALSIPVLNDSEGMLAAQWGVRGVPTSFIVDTTGRIRFVEVGYTTEIGLRLRLWLARVWVPPAAAIDPVVPGQ